MSKLAAFRRGWASLSQDFRGKVSSLCQHIETTRKATLPLTVLYNETLQQTSRPLLLKLSQRRQIQVFDPHFEEVRGSVEPWMAHWKARVAYDFLFVIIELFSLALTVDTLQGKTCQTSLL